MIINMLKKILLNKHKHQFPQINDSIKWASNENNDKKYKGLNLYNMSFNLTDIGEVNIWTESPCKLKPHFHVVSKDCKYDICLRMDIPSYYTDFNYESFKLNTIQLVELNRYLNSTNEYTHKTNWETLALIWNGNNLTKKHFNINKCPDYLKLNRE